MIRTTFGGLRISQLHTWSEQRLWLLRLKFDILTKSKIYNNSTFFSTSSGVHKNFIATVRTKKTVKNYFQNCCHLLTLINCGVLLLYAYIVIKLKSKAMLPNVRESSFQSFTTQIFSLAIFNIRALRIK